MIWYVINISFLTFRPLVHTKNNNFGRFGVKFQYRNCDYSIYRRHMPKALCLKLCQNVTNIVYCDQWLYASHRNEWKKYCIRYKINRWRVRQRHQVSDANINTCFRTQCTLVQKCMSTIYNIVLYKIVWQSKVQTVLLIASISINTHWREGGLVATLRLSGHLPLVPAPCNKTRGSPP